MNTSELNLLNPPIVEAVLDLDCDLPPGLDLQAVESRMREAFQDRYTEARPVYLDEHRIEAPPMGPAKFSTARLGLQAVQYAQKDGKQIVQARKQGYAFNRLTPYEGFSHYLPEIQRTWRLYCGLALPVQVRVIRLRFINRILLPLTGGHVELKAYVRVAPQLPPMGSMVLTGFATQTAAMDPTTGENANLVLTAQPVDQGRLPLIFDLVVAAPVMLEPSDWQGIERGIESLRTLKNRLFRHSMTDKCLSLFQ